MKRKVNGKRKGSKFELDIAKQIATTLGIEYGKYIRRTPGSGSLLCRSDLWVHRDYRWKFNLYLELKKRQTIHLEQVVKTNNDIVKWYKEAKQKLTIDPEYDNPMETVVALIFARNNVLPFILMSYQDFLDLEISKNYPKSNLKLTFTDNDENDFIVLDWNAFINSYKV